MVKIGAGNIEHGGGTVNSRKGGMSRLAALRFKLRLIERPIWGWEAVKQTFKLLVVLLDLKIYRERSRYRLGSIALIPISYLAVASVQIGVPAWLVFVIGVASRLVLTIITYHRLRDAGYSSAWLFLMILQFQIGPTSHLSEHVSFNVGASVVALVPVILGWIVPANSNRKGRSESG